MDELLFHEYGTVLATDEENIRENSLTNKMVGIGKPFFRGRFGLSYQKDNGGKYVRMTDIKLLYMALSKIGWSKTGNNFDVKLSREEVCELLNLENDHYAAFKLRRIGEHLASVSWIKWDIRDKKGAVGSEDGFLVKGFGIEPGGKNIIVRLNDDYSFLFETLTDNKQFLMMWVNDIYKMNSSAAYLLYEDLRFHSDSRKNNTRYYSDEMLKKVLRIPDKGTGSYMHRVKNKDYFDRNKFETKVLIPATKDIAECKMLYLKPQELDVSFTEDGGIKSFKNQVFFKRVKQNGKVVGYEFEYTIMTRRSQIKQAEAQEDDNEET